MNNPGLGGKIRTKDRRDYSPQSLGMVSPYPDTFASPIPTVYMQGTYGTCGAHAGAALANVLFNIISSPKYLWKKIKETDGYDLDVGTDMRSIFKAMQSGVCELSLLDNNQEQSIEAYSDANEITPPMEENASKHKISNYGFVDSPTISQIKENIYKYKAVLLLVDCGDGWWLPSWGTQNNPLHVGNFVGHHFICATEYGMTLIDGPNSWSTLWGDKGMFRFDEGYTPHVLELGFATLQTKYIFNNNLFFGTMNNADVHALQARIGMPVEYQTGNFLFKTFSAVRAYQLANKIPTTGYVGPLTRSRLNTT
jgi:peptidoglycan hydrolase-like protein with peptidoglycan-binding domain